MSTEENDYEAEAQMIRRSAREEAHRLADAQGMTGDFRDEFVAELVARSEMSGAQQEPTVTTRPEYLAERLKREEMEAAAQRRLLDELQAAKRESREEQERAAQVELLEAQRKAKLERTDALYEGRATPDEIRAHSKSLEECRNRFDNEALMARAESVKERWADRMATEGFKILQAECHENSVAHGFWDGPDGTNLASKVALIHSELSELLEVYRGKAKPKEGLDMTPEEEEMADVLIRLCDLAGHRGIDLFAVALKKHAFNLKRPHKHGRNF